MCATHRVGTYRQADFDCEETWLTRHVNYDHALAVSAMATGLVLLA